MQRRLFTHLIRATILACSLLLPASATAVSAEVSCVVPAARDADERRALEAVRRPLPLLRVADATPIALTADGRFAVFCIGDTARRLGPGEDCDSDRYAAVSLDRRRIEGKPGDPAWWQAFVKKHPLAKLAAPARVAPQANLEAWLSADWPGAAVSDVVQGCVASASPRAPVFVLRQLKPHPRYSPFSPLMYQQRAYTFDAAALKVVAGKEVLITFAWTSDGQWLAANLFVHEGSQWAWRDGGFAPGQARVEILDAGHASVDKLAEAVEQAGYEVARKGIAAKGRSVSELFSVPGFESDAAELAERLRIAVKKSPGPMGSVPASIVISAATKTTTHQLEGDCTMQVRQDDFLWSVSIAVVCGKKEATQLDVQGAAFDEHEGIVETQIEGAATWVVSAWDRSSTYGATTMVVVWKRDDTWTMQKAPFSNGVLQADGSFIDRAYEGPVQYFFSPRTGTFISPP